MIRYSVVIPVYRVEDYLPACIDSVLEQETAFSYEILLIDDGSPDRCGEICDEYAA
ncbi:MAG: glycosyltransferase, partial [Oscillospiraceae bacterium]|nr:glycosyltransferase [Oscillospiraceae bacterium]